MNDKKNRLTSPKRPARRTDRFRPRFESLEQRILLAVLPGEWNPLGPFSSTNGQVENIANKPVAGAIHTVLAHPSNPNTLYVGSVNGGVWKTIDATASQPKWTPLTDRMPSQSIGALAFDVGDSTTNTIYAGVGLYSSYGQLGNQRIGLMRSTNSGLNWQVVDGGGVLTGKNISGVYANGSTIVVSVNVADTFNFSNIGIFRSTDVGASFTQISTGNGSSTGLPAGVSYDLVADPLNPSVLYTSIVFSPTAGGNGVYKSTNAGGSWTKVSTPAMDALIVNNTSNLEMSAGRNNEVYAAIINRGAAVGIFRSPDNGLTWAAMDLPVTNETGGDVGLNPRGGKGPTSGTPQVIAGGQGGVHFSILADPNNANIVYVGGDRQPRGFNDAGSFPNAIGASDFSGRLFRGDASRPAGSQFVHLTHRNTLGAAGGGTASNSAPHADSRDMAFDANGNLIEVDDGGVYRRTSPKNNTGDWFSVNGDLQVKEAHDIAWDSLSNVAMTGNQDTGSTYQSTENARQWVSLSTGDGGDIAIDNIQLAGSNRSVRYSSSQNLFGFRSTVWDASGALLSTSFPALTPAAGSTAIVGAFRTPVETNSVAGGRLLIQGANGLYESLNAGTTVTAIGAGLGVSTNGLLSNAIWYGGTKNNVANPDLVWAANDSDVYLRKTGTGNVNKTVGDPTSQLIRDLAVNSRDSDHVFVVDDSHVYQSTNAGDTWVDITGNLLTLADSLLSVAFVVGPLTSSILVGTNLGVFAAATNALGTWNKLGSLFPNVLAIDMDYDTTDDILLVGTMGRGAWSLANTKVVLETITKKIDIALGNDVAFVENSLPVLVAPAATVTEQSIPTYDGGVLSLSISNNYQIGDLLNFASQGVGAGEISIFGTQVSFDGTLIGTYSGPGRSINVTLTAGANRLAIEKLLSRATFVHSTDDPSPLPREVSAFLDNGFNGASKRATVLVNVTPVNDAPSSSNVSLTSIDEDTKNHPGSLIAVLVGPSFLDPDSGSTLSGIAVTSNDALISSGQWEYSVDAVNWLPVGNVSPVASLTLSSSTRLRFSPMGDYFGTPTALSYRALDDSYADSFTASIRQFIDVTNAIDIGPVALVGARIGIQITSVNDMPVTKVANQVLSVDQDNLFVLPIPVGWFTDVDDANLNLSFSSVGGAPPPAWLTLNQAIRQLVGTPANEDVGVYDLVLRATDAAGLFTTLDVQVSVINVNDAPTNIQLIGNSVRENAAGVFLGTLFVTDKDSSDQFTWQVFDQRFAIVDNFLYLAAGSRLDYEANSQIDIQIGVTDSGTPPLSLTLTKTINVLDVNEFVPAFPPTQFNVSESAGGGSSIGFLAASDGDRNDTIRYRITGAPQSIFALDSNTGRISLRPGVTLDNESIASYQLFVEASDSGLPSLSTTSSVNINVVDVNEFEPQLTTRSISLSERQAIGVPFTRIAAFDGDTRQSIQFSLLSTENRFTINPNTGELSLNRPGLFDFETRPVDSLVVVTTDSGLPQFRTATSVAILVQDANDPPTAATVANPNLLSNISELSLGKISIADQDVGQQYIIVSGDGRFTIVGDKLVLAAGNAIGDSDPLQFFVPIIATEIGASSNSYNLNIALNRIPNKSPWQNPINRLDVNRLDGVNPLDALAIINALNGNEFSRLPFPRPASTLSLPDFDVDGDGTINPLDVLAIINFLNNASNGEGEAKANPLSLDPTRGELDDATWLAAYTQIEEERVTTRRRRN
jgi:hypothetical protein